MLNVLQYKVWVKPSAEMSFLYGNHVTKAGTIPSLLPVALSAGCSCLRSVAGLGRITEGVPQHAGVVVFNMSNVPLGTLAFTL